MTFHHNRGWDWFAGSLTFWTNCLNHLGQPSHLVHEFILSGEYRNPIGDFLVNSKSPKVLRKHAIVRFLVSDLYKYEKCITHFQLEYSFTSKMCSSWNWETWWSRQSLRISFLIFSQNFLTCLHQISKRNKNYDELVCPANSDILSSHQKTTRHFLIPMVSKPFQFKP